MRLLGLGKSVYLNLQRRISCGSQSFGSSNSFLYSGRCNCIINGTLSRAPKNQSTSEISVKKCYPCSKLMPILQTFANLGSIKPNLKKIANHLFTRWKLQNFAKLCQVCRSLQTIGRVRSGRALLNLAKWDIFLTIFLWLLNSIEKCLKYNLKTICVVKSPYKANY